MEPIENTTRRSKEITEQQVSYLPPELWIEILARLPAISLLKFRSVCKSWCSSIDDPNFVSMHITSNKDNREGTYMFYYETPNFTEPREFRIRYCHALHEPEPINLGNLGKLRLSQWWTLCSYVNGLLLAYGIGYDIFLCNPSIRLGLKLPSPPHPATNLGLGFHSSGNDYKVVALMYSYRTAFTQCTSVSTYSLKTGLWRNNVVAPPSLHSLSAKSVFVKGAIHWMGSNKRGDLQVLSFHVADEEFSYIELPMFGGGGNNGNPLRRRIFAFGDSLALMDIVKTQGFSFIWVMEKYGAVESWTRRHVINICDYPIHVSVLKNGKLWLFRTFDRQISYDTETKQTKALSNFLAHRPYFAETYLESLVLFRGAGGQVGSLPFHKIGDE
ncbi:hypothetical protein Ancab_021604 [Ancistrocladus abbreviatus]